MRILRSHGAIFCACLFSVTGCHAYLHDDGLQTQTNTIAEGFKAAAVPDALTGLITHQTQENAANVQSVIDRETALRESALVALIGNTAADSRFKASTEAFNAAIDKRIKALGYGTDPNLHPATYANLVRTNAEAAADDAYVKALAQDYADAGGKDFKDCASFKNPANAAAAHLLYNYCLQDWPGSHDALAEDVKNFAPKTAGILANAMASLKATTDAITAEQVAEQKQSASLKAQQDKINAAASRSGDTVKDDIQKLHDLITSADNALAIVGGPSLGNALATVKFKTANLCDLIAAPSGTTCEGGAANTNTKTNAAAVMAGITNSLNDLSSPDPSAAALQLVAAQGEAALLSRQLGYLKQRQAIQQDEVNKLEGEVAYLVAAKIVLNAAAAEQTPDCANLNFEQLLTSTTKCPDDVRRNVAQALVNYNYAWGYYRVAATADFYKDSGIVRIAQVDAETAAGGVRVQIAQSFLNTMESYGQGGVKPETIAAFIQALGIPAAIAGQN
jgi:hypothetical protein